MASTAFYHSLTVCGYMLCITEEVARTLRSRRTAGPPVLSAADEQAARGATAGEDESTALSTDASVTLALNASDAATTGSGATTNRSGETTNRASRLAASEEVDLTLGPDAHVLLEVAPKVQATGCRCVHPLVLESCAAPPNCLNANTHLQDLLQTSCTGWRLVSAIVILGAARQGQPLPCRLVMLIGSLIKSANANAQGEAPATPPRHPRAASASVSPIGSSPTAAGSLIMPQATIPDSPARAGISMAPASPLRMSLSRRCSDATGAGASSRTASAAVDAWQSLSRSEKRASTGSGTTPPQPDPPGAPRSSGEPKPSTRMAPSRSRHLTHGLSSVARATSRLFRSRSRAAAGDAASPPKHECSLRPPAPPASSSPAEHGPAEQSQPSGGTGCGTPPRHSLSARSRGLSLCVMAIDEPLAALGPFTPAEQPVSPMSRDVVRRRLEPHHQRHSLAPRPELLNAIPSSPCANALPSPTIGLLDAALAFSLNSPTKRDSSRGHSRGSPSLTESSLGLQRSVVLANLARVIPGDPGAAQSPQRNASCPLLEPAPCPGAPPTPDSSQARSELPKSLTIEEVGRVQAALARELVTFGTELLLLLHVRCERLCVALAARQCSAPRGGDAASDEGRFEKTGATLRNCQRLVQAQIAMLHNFDRWTNVLGPCSSNADSSFFAFPCQVFSGVPGSPISCGGSPGFGRACGHGSPSEGRSIMSARSPSVASARMHSNLPSQRSASELALEGAAAQLQRTLEDIMVRGSGALAC
jgi:hypothetical protein